VTCLLGRGVLKTDAGSPPFTKGATGGAERPGPRTKGDRFDRWILVYLGCAVLVLAYLSPSLIAARLQLGFPSVSTVSGFPVAWRGIYFFSLLSVALAYLVAHFRKAGVVQSTLLAVAGLGAFEFLYGVAYATSTRRFGLLLPQWGLPATGWAGFGTWLLVEFLVASFALLGWDRAGVDRTVQGVGVLFFLGLVLWGVGLGWSYPPFDNSPAVFFVNTLTEVSGTLLVPLGFTSRPRPDADLVHRAWHRTLGRRSPPATSLPAFPRGR